MSPENPKFGKISMKLFLKELSMELTIISLGGSIIVPDGVDYAFLKSLRNAISGYLERNEGAKLVLVAGGGAPARKYQEALRMICDNAPSDVQDWLGIKATHLNAMLIKGIFSEYITDDIVTDPTAEDIEFKGRMLAAGGWKPGFSTDTDAVYLARRFGAKKIINLSNIKKVYTADPKKDPNAEPIDRISWEDFRKMVGDEWVPGKNAPFDPIASKLADESNLTVICADGRNIENTIAILEGRDAEGTIIGA